MGGISGDQYLRLLMICSICVDVKGEVLFIDWSGRIAKFITHKMHLRLRDAQRPVTRTLIMVLGMNPARGIVRPT